MLEKFSSTLAEETERFVKRTRNTWDLLTGPKPRDRVGQTPSRVVFARNKMRLLRYLPAPGVPTDTTQQPLLFVPSVINRHYILDLQPGKSLIEYLVNAGYDVFMVDWGKPTAEDRYHTFDDYIELLVHAAVKRACRLSGHDKLHLIGHCLGGLMTIPYAALYPRHIHSLMNLTTPFDLRHGGILKQWTDSMNVDTMVDALGNAPWPLLQASFHMLKPMGLLQKAAWFYEQLWNDKVIDQFVALETWVNDNVSLAGEFFRTYIKEIYQNNGLYNESLVVNGRQISYDHLQVPVLNIAAQGDHIAPAPSVLALKDKLPQTQNITFRGGHIGAVLSRNASKHLWPQIDTFFRTGHAAPP